MRIEYDWEKASFNDKMFASALADLSSKNCDENTLFGTFEYSLTDENKEQKFFCDVLPNKPLNNFRLEVFGIVNKDINASKGSGKLVTTLEFSDVLPSNYPEFTRRAGKKISLYHGLSDEGTNKCIEEKETLLWGKKE